MSGVLLAPDPSSAAAMRGVVTFIAQLAQD